MKQGRRAQEGASRQEGEKPWRRSVVGMWKSRRKVTTQLSGWAGPRESPVPRTLKGKGTSWEAPQSCSATFCGSLQVVKL